MKNGFEIERRFLIFMPDISFLQNNSKSVLNITQTYLADRSRIRKIKTDGEVTYIKTVKERISDIKRLEKEWEITKEEYERELENKNPNTKQIIKTRYVYLYKNKNFEIDVFSFWKDRAIAEIELECEEQGFELPPFIKVIKEVTADHRYNNSSLALAVITEEINEKE